MIQARRSTWCTATAITTFSIVSSQNPFVQSSELQAFASVTASFLVLCQIISMLPASISSRKILWLLFLVPVIPYTVNMVTTWQSYHAAWSSFRSSTKHPVEELIEQANQHFDRLLERQSQNYTAAHMEYQRRYGIEPPRGFEAWYQYAVSHDSPIIDDFDVIHKSLSPLLKLSGEKINQIMDLAYHTRRVNLWDCRFSTNTSSTHCVHPSKTNDRSVTLLFNTTLKNLQGILPDVRFLFNHLDEPRVLISPPTNELPSTHSFNFTDFSSNPTWEVLTDFCSAPQPLSQPLDTIKLPFLTSPGANLSLCENPTLAKQHGLLTSPTSFSLIQGPVPVLSTGTLSTMSDLLFPSPAYIESRFIYDEASDMEWDKKRNNLYWAGSNTGGFAGTDESRKALHRQRFVATAQNLEGQEHLYLEEHEGAVKTYKSSFLNGRLYDVAFTRISQCEPRYCRQQKDYFRIKPWTDKDKVLGSKLVFDLDGNGISGRYYKLLASNSTPLKQTVLREWHDERLVPWVHYVPVSMGMEELPELVRWLTSNKRGQEAARRIAERGSEWYKRSLRRVDMGIYLYRLMLELARLQDPAREAFTYN